MSSCHSIEPGPKPAPVMGQLPSTMPNMIIVLTLICALMGATLSAVYLLTKPKIDSIAVIKEQAAVAKVLPDFDNDPSAQVRWFDQNGHELDVSKPENGPLALIRAYPASKDGQLVGVAVKSFSDKGYSKRITLMTGFAADGSIIGIKVMDQSETPGLGTKMKEPAFQNQFKEKNPATFKLAVKKDGGDVDAITAATISSRAVCDALNRAYTAFGEVKQ